MLPLTFLLLSYTLSAFSKPLESFHENLSIRHTNDGKVLTTFTFTTLLHDTAPFPPREDEDEFHDHVHYSIFPLPLGQILRVNRVPEMHMTLNSGKWDYARWGVEDDVGSGGEVWAWMAGNNEGVNDRWVALHNGLGGLFCASLSDAHQISAATPTLTFPPRGSLPALSNTSHSYHLRYTTLPAERLCTENLTPFLKLLPCNARAGLAELLNPHALVGADWHGMAAHVRWVTDEEENGIELKLIVRSAFDPLRTSDNGLRSWSLQSLFNRQISRRCPVASQSQIKLHVPSSQDTYNIDPQRSIAPNDTVFYDLLSDNSQETVVLPINIHFKQTGSNLGLSSLHSTKHASPVLLSRKLMEDDSQIQTHSRLRVDFRNTLNTSLDVVYTEIVPWFFVMYLHSLTVSGHATHKILTYSPSEHPHSTSTTSVKSPTHLSLGITLPPLSTTKLTMDIEFAFLRYTEYVPDAQRGVDIPGGVLRILSAGAPGHSELANLVGTRLYTQPLLVSLPTPDFSMPYNVIVMSSTVIGFMFAHTFNTLVRRWIWVKV